MANRKELTNYEETHCLRYTTDEIRMSEYKPSRKGGQSLPHLSAHCSNLISSRREGSSMKKGFCVVAIGLLFVLSGELAYSQEHEPEKAPRTLPGRPPMPMPGGPMGGMMGPGGMAMMLQALRDNPKLAGMMMQMHGEMMRIRGEEMTKMGDVMRRYGERLEKESSK